MPRPRSWSLSLPVALLTAALMSFHPARSAAETPRVHALTGATVVVAPCQVLPHATVVIRDGIIEAVGADVVIPADARIWDAESLVVYPGLIDAYVRRSKLFGQTPQPTGEDDDFDAVEVPARGATHPNRRVHPQYALSDRLDFRPDLWKPFHTLGFTTAYVVPDSGIFRGEGAAINLRAGRTSEITLGGQTMQCLGYDTGTRRDLPPLADGGRGPDATDLSRRPARPRCPRHLRRLPGGTGTSARRCGAPGPRAGDHGRAPVLFETTDVLSLHRSWRIAQEFGLRAVLRGSGDEYKRIPLVQSVNAALILPVAFPDPPAMETDDDARDVTFAVAPGVGPRPFESGQA
ncbi:MAG: hypothetical protein IPK72_21945 [Candidatus Eisenbacteria bacterium]|nr:hypothetical protein [Candidatus Eisenbacteria bacterium]